MTVKMAAPLSRFGLRSLSRGVLRLTTFKQPQASHCSPLKDIFESQNLFCNCHSVSAVNTTFYRWYSSTLQERKCWKCDSPTNERSELFFCNCGVVQKVPADLTYFEAMDCPEAFNIDVSKLPDLYKERQRNLHPDKYAQKTKDEQMVAENQSAFINKAYKTLMKPLTRGLYLLELKGDPLDEKNNAVDMNFLSEIMEMNEELMEASDHPEVIEDIEKTNTKKMEDCIKVVSDAFKVENIPKAKEYLIRLKYFTNIDDKLKEIQRMHMDT